jgi:hypothetical protein
MTQKESIRELKKGDTVQVTTIEGETTQMRVIGKRRKGSLPQSVTQLSQKLTSPLSP